MPGTQIRTATRSGPVNASAPASGRYFSAFQADRGRVGTAVRCASYADFEAEYGPVNAYGSGHADARTFFEEGGTELYGSRVVGPAATRGTLQSVDRAGAPLATLRYDAISAGTWSSTITRQVKAGTLAGTYAIVITGPGLAGVVTAVETYDNLTTPQDAVEALIRSRFVRATNLGSATATPLNQPAIIAATALSAGTDDRASITAATMVAGLDTFTADLGAGSVAIPGYASSLVGAGIKTHQVANRRLGILATAIGATESDVTTAALNLLAVDSDGLGIFWPWIRVPSQVIGSSALTRLISPEGYVAAMRARAHRAAGPWVAPAGEIATAKYVVGLEQEVPRAMGDRLDDANVSAIRTIAGGTRLYGWRSLSTNVADYALLTGRDTLNTVSVEAERRLERFVFRTIDGRGMLLASVAAEMVGLLDPIRAAGGLFELIVAGDQVDPGYSVDVGPTLNTLANLALNRITAVLALRVSPVGTLLDVTIVKVAITAAV